MLYFLAALFGGGFFLFNSFASPKKVSRTVESALRKLFPGADVRAEIQGKRGRDVVKGRFRAARLEMSRFSFDAGASLGVQVVPSAKDEGRIGRLEVALRDFTWQGFRVAALEMQIDNVAVDWRALRKQSQLKLVSPPGAPRTVGRARLALGADALQTWARQRYPDIQNATVSLSTDRTVRVAGQRAFLGAAVGIELTGRLQMREARVLEVASPQVSAAGVALAPALAAPLTRGLSSIYELDPGGRWPLSARATDLRVENRAGVATLVLDADVAVKPAQ